MAKSARGLPSSFNLDLPEDGPVLIGDFLDEPPPVVVKSQPRVVESPIELKPAGIRLRPEVVSHEKTNRVQEPTFGHPVRRPVPTPDVIRYQLNLTPKAKKMLEEVVEHVRTYSPERNTRVCEVFQGIIGLLHRVMNELELSELPRRGAWGSVTAKNFPGALSDAFEKAILRAAGKR